MKEVYIQWLSELSKREIFSAGTKGANLGELYKLGFSIPSAFILTSQTFRKFIEKNSLKEPIDKLLSEINLEDEESLEKNSKEIQELIISSKIPEDIESEILESYDTFNVDLDEMKESSYALAIMKTAREPVFVSVRSSIVPENLEDINFPGQEETYINIKGNKELIETIRKVFSSTFSPRSILYRAKKEFNLFPETAIIIQKMIDTEKSGVILSTNPLDNNILVESIFGQGVGISSGRINPDRYTLSKDLEIVYEKIPDKKFAIVRDSSGITKTIQLNEEKSSQKVLQTHQIKQLGEYALKLEEYFGKPQEIEFSIENGIIYLLQTKTIFQLENKENQELEGQFLVKGIVANKGISSGTVKIIHSSGDLNKLKEGDVLVSQIINSDMFVAIQKASAIVLDDGGITSNIASFARELDIPLIVGTRNGTSKLEEGMNVTVDGFSGKVFLGKAENKGIEISPVVETKTKIKTIIELVESAERASKTANDGGGMIKIENIIASSGKHSLRFQEENNLEEYKNILLEGLEKIAKRFFEKELWIRTSNIQTDEYSNLEGTIEVEKNPKLGLHGIKFSLKNKELFKTELLAIKELETRNKIGILIPNISSLEEIQEVKKIMQELNFPNSIKLGIIIETPASVVLIKDICESGIDFISIYLENLTQYTLGIDKENEQLKQLYNENGWAIKKQISRVIRETKQHKIENSICLSEINKGLVEFLIQQKIDSISINLDKAKELSELVRGMENNFH